MNLRDLKRLGANSRRNLIVVSGDRDRREDDDGPPEQALTYTRPHHIHGSDGIVAVCPWCSAATALNDERQVRLASATRGAKFRCSVCGQWARARFDKLTGGRP